MCPNCEIEMEVVEGVIQKATPMSDEVWGDWMECPKCGYQDEKEAESE